MVVGAAEGTAVDVIADGVDVSSNAVGAGALSARLRFALRVVSFLGENTCCHDRSMVAWSFLALGWNIL